MTFRNLPAPAPAVLALAALLAAGAAAAGGPAEGSLDVQPTRTLVTFAPAAAGASDVRSQLVALPFDAREADVSVVAGRATSAAAVGGVMRLRGQPVVNVVVRGGDGAAVTVAVAHDGSWGAAAPARLASDALHAGLPGAPDGGKADHGPGRGSYVIVTAPEFADAVAGLADWKRRKGWPVVVATTAETGTARDQIQAWLQNAYDTWDQPPEYVLLVGDTPQIPTFVVVANPSDQPYVQLDGDDWLADAMIGRLPVTSAAEAAVVAGKAVAYERDPYRGEDGTDDAWVTRSIIVAGNESSTTPVATVTWCQGQLEELGFAPSVPLQTSFLQPPLPPNAPIPQWFNPSLVTGASLVIYRGWAYGIRGWSSPRYYDADLVALHNGQKMPVVISFVCDNGDYDSPTDCFGESFLNLGSQAEPYRGAVAFIGNTEFHSHTRQNDAMAIAFFEEVLRPDVTTLGAWVAASKLRFIDFFPMDLEIATHGELSVEFYHNIYNLLGDPELNFHKGPLREMTVAAPTQLATGANHLAVAVGAAEGGPLAGARVGVVQDGQLLGRGVTGPDGEALVVFAAPAAEGLVEVTVTRSGRVTEERALAVGTAATSFLTVAAVAVDDDDAAPSQGNGDQVANPGETLAVLPTLANAGGQASPARALALTLTGPGAVVDGAAGAPAIAAGGQAAADGPFVIEVAAAAADGDTLVGVVEAADGGGSSQFHLVVRAPRLTVADVAGSAEPGLTSSLLLTLRNDGSVPTAGGTVTVTLPAGLGATVVDGTAAFGPLAPGASAAALDAIALAVDAATAVGAGLPLAGTIVTSEGAETPLDLTLLAGDPDVSAPVGPDAHGYWVYDSADVLYPQQQPVYAWTELDPSVRPDAPGTGLVFTTDNYDHVVVDLPFGFTYYGQTFDRLRVSDNGWISFDADDATYNFYNWPLPSHEGPGALIAPFWDNLDPTFEFDPDANDSTGVGSSGIFTHHDAAAGTFTVEWSRQRHLINSIRGLQTFQVVLQDQDPAATGREDDDVLFLYKQVANNDYERMWASVGFESPDEDQGLQLTHGNLYAPGVPPLGPGLAMRVTTEPPVRVPLRLARLAAEPAEGGVLVSWDSADARPVTGWEVWRDQAGARTNLTPQPLTPGARAFLAPGDAGDAFVLVARHPYGARSTAGTVVAGAAGAGLARLGPTWPNPLRAEGAIAFALPRAGSASLRIFDLRGRCVRTLLDGEAAAGEGVARWDGLDESGRALPDGVYLARLETAGATLTHKLLVVR